MPFESFKREFGAPQAGTAGSLDSMRLDRSDPLRAFVDDVGGGVFDKGFISVASVREVVASLGGWERYLPPGSTLFASSAFGVLFTTTTGDDVWITETQYGQIVESDYSIADLIGVLGTEEVRDDLLRKPLFQSWNEVVGHLPPTHVLSPAPALPLGGSWSLDKLSPVSLPVYLSFTSQLFGDDSGTAIEVRRRVR